MSNAFNVLYLYSCILATRVFFDMMCRSVGLDSAVGTHFLQCHRFPQFVKLPILPRELHPRGPLSQTARTYRGGSAEGHLQLGQSQLSLPLALDRP
jgi:hypothetical protein